MTGLNALVVIAWGQLLDSGTAEVYQVFVTRMERPSLILTDAFRNRIEFARGCAIH